MCCILIRQFDYHSSVKSSYCHYLPHESISAARFSSLSCPTCASLTSPISFEFIYQVFRLKTWADLSLIIAGYILHFNYTHPSICSFITTLVIISDHQSIHQVKVIELASASFHHGRTVVTVAITDKNLPHTVIVPIRIYINQVICC